MKSVVVLLITDLLSSAFCVQSTVTDSAGGRMVVSTWLLLSFLPTQGAYNLGKQTCTNNYNVKQKVIGFAIKLECCECLENVGIIPS